MSNRSGPVAQLHRYTQEKESAYKDVSSRHTCQESEDLLGPDAKIGADQKATPATDCTFAQFCAVSLSSGNDVNLEVCHIVPKDLGSERHTQLEFAWGYPYNTFNLDTSGNLFRLTPDLQAAFDRSSWALFPLEQDILDKMYVHYRPTWPNNHQVVNFHVEYLYGRRTAFDYIFFPLPGEKCYRDPIGRRRRLESLDHLHMYPGADYYDFPYTDFPLLKLPILPHYAIYDLGNKLKTLGISIENILTDNALFPLIHKHRLMSMVVTCINLYYRWTTVPAPDSFANGRSRLDTPKEESPYDDQDPARCTLRSEAKRKSDAGDNNTRPSSSGRQGLCDKDIGSEPHDLLSPNDSLTYAGSLISATDEGPDDEDFTDDETDSSFYRRIGDWLQEVDVDSKLQTDIKTAPRC